jgi:hypothetical protein
VSPIGARSRRAPARLGYRSVSLRERRGARARRTPPSG